MIEQGPANHFVDGIMAADIFADDEQVPGGVEEGGGVQAAGALENILGFAQGLRQFCQQL